VIRRSSSPLSRKAGSNLQPIDKELRAAGLDRAKRDLRRPGKDPATQQELAVPAPAVTGSANGVGLLQIPGWRNKKSLHWLWHGFSTRRGGVSRPYCAEDAEGDLNLGFTTDDQREAVLENRRLLVEAVSGDASTPLVPLRQFHSNLVVIADKDDANRERPRKADGVISAVAGLLVGIQTADCIPVLVADRKQRIVGAFHAGWRGTVKRIVELGVGRMRLEFGCRPQDLIAAIGPGNSRCCYSVGEEVLSEFESQFVYARELFREVFDSDPVRAKYPMLFLTQRAPGHSAIGPALHLNLIEANRRQLVDAGLKPSAISITGGCTSCHGDLFFSHRASRGHTGRMMSVIGICS
jgi:polyphenol oxidase